MTAVGGINDLHHSNEVFNLKDGSTWVKEFPPMPTSRASPTSIHIEVSLIVIGGRTSKSTAVCPVEVMNIITHQWSIAANVPASQEFLRASGVICGNQLYFLGGLNSKSVYSCPLSDLLQSCQPTSESKAATRRQSNIWRQLAELPIYQPTCVSLCGHLLAIGGAEGVTAPSKAVRTYKPASNTWEVISEMLEARRLCFAIALPTTNEVMIVGGYDSYSIKLSSVEFVSLIQ